MYVNIDDLNVLQFDHEKDKLQHDKDKLNYDINKYLHEHSWKRLMWYRDELWRVTIPVWTAFGSLNAAVLAISLKNEADLSVCRASYILIGLFGFGLLIMRVYSWYVKTMYAAVATLNELVKDNENCLKAGSDANYGHFKSVPALPELFYTIGFILIFVAAGITLNSVNDNTVKTDSMSSLLYSIKQSIPQVHKVAIGLFLLVMTSANAFLYLIIPVLSSIIRFDFNAAKWSYNATEALEHKTLTILNKCLKRKAETNLGEVGSAQPRP